MNNPADVVLLIADSQIEALSRLRDSLGRASLGCRVICAESGRSALEGAKTTVPDAVLSDMRLSDMSGLGLLLKIKARNPDVVTIMMSDCGSQEARRMCLDAGVDFFFEKPLDVNRLIGMLGTSSGTDDCVFRGTLDNLSVPDVLQLVICRPSTMLMEVESAHGKGIIEIENGQVIHARVNGLVGEEAFYELVRWEDGAFEVTDRSGPEERTIALPLPQLLVTAADRSESDRRLHQASEAVQETYAPFFPVEETAHEASSIWAPMAPYARPAAGRPRRSAHSAQWNAEVKVPRLSRFRFHPDKSVPLEVCKKDPPRAGPATPPQGRIEGKIGRTRRQNSLLPGPRRIAAASAVAFVVMLFGLRFFGVLSPHYARNVAPALGRLFGEYTPSDAPTGNPHGDPKVGNTFVQAATPAMPRTAAAPTGTPDAVQLGLGVRRDGDGSAPAYAISVSRNHKITASANVVGVSSTLFKQLGLRSNPWIQLIGPAGKTIGVLATRLPEAETPIVLPPEVHDALSHGRVDLTHVRIRPVYWARDGETGSLDFKGSQDLAGEYSEYWFSVGLSLTSMLQLGLTPGAYATLEGPAGTQSVRIQLVDRGNTDEIWLSEAVREAVGADQRDASLSVFPKS